jgi:hypothetical protein
MIEAIPKHAVNIPQVFRDSALRRITQEEFDYVFSLEDVWVDKRKINSCMICSNNGNSDMIMTLCCLSLVCVSCCEKSFIGSNFECPYCKTNFSSFEAHEVFVPPELEKPKTETTAKSFINTWRSMLETKLSIRRGKK